TWYRYHALFAETLRGHLQKQQPGLLPELYRRASQWYEEQQGLEEACAYALLAGDFPNAARLVGDLLPSMIERGHFEQLGRWLRQLPPELIASSPQLYIVTPWLHAFSTSEPDVMDYTLQLMEQHVQQLPEDEIESWVEPQSVLTFFKALNALGNNDLAGAFRLVRQALGAINPRKTPMSRLIARFLRISLSLVHGASGDLATAEQILLDLTRVNSDEVFSLVNLAAPFLLGELYRAQGLLHKGHAIYTRMEQIVESHAEIPPMPLIVLTFAMLRHSSLLYEWNCLPQAAHVMRRVMELLPQSFSRVIPSASQPELLAFGLWAQARIALAQGQPEAADYFLELVRNQSAILDRMPPGKEEPPVNIATLTARLALLCGYSEEVDHWESTCTIRCDDRPTALLDSRNIFAYLTLARILLARGRTQPGEEALSQALTLLENWRSFVQKTGFQGWLIEIQMLTALTLQAQGQLHEALSTLGAVLPLAEGEGYARLFIDEGQPMADLLSQVGAYTTASPGYLRRLQNALSASRPALPMPAQTAPTPAALDPLSGRENEVLTLLAAGYSNQQIADRLIISLNTAKRHVKNILAKLDATNRTQAVARARELHLL
ncbi:MAG TPA: LuxR C-terminal-related transcriptional regulator, partial [Ktedonobacteraceae bacterium]|nr:LuxR C-terminal-related transcriptional regulator [Ktedonobacteraceae bacterium]